MRAFHITLILYLLLGSATVLAEEHPAATPVKPGEWPDFFALHEHFKQQAKAGGKDLLFVGDSITFGWLTAGKNVLKAQPWASRAAIFGIPGDQTQWMLWRLNDGELEGLQPRVIVLMAGTNNLKSGRTRMPPQVTAEGVVALLKLLKDKCPQAHLVLMGILPRQPEYAWIAAAIKETNQILEAAAKEHGATWVDLGPRFLDEQGALRQELMPDLLHPSEPGYEIWAEALKPILAEKLPTAP